MKRFGVAFLVSSGLLVLSLVPLASAQSSLSSTQPQIRFDSFTAVYHLSRDSHGLSLLTSEETIVADFPGSGSFYGVERAIPKTYQNHTVNVKILGVSDAAGNPVPYKTSGDRSNDLVVTTGDPSITLYGNQTIKIAYQTTGVIDLGKGSDEFILNVNGRGWDQPFGRVEAVLYVPKVFGVRIKSGPSCYLGLNATTSSACQISTQPTAQGTVITSKAQSLLPHQALIVNLEFQPATFTNYHAQFSVRALEIAGALFALIATVVLLVYIYKTR